MENSTALSCRSFDRKRDTWQVREATASPTRAGARKNFRVLPGRWIRIAADPLDPPDRSLAGGFAELENPRVPALRARAVAGWLRRARQFMKKRN
jgi:hypothetical protein